MHYTQNPDHADLRVLVIGRKVNSADYIEEISRDLIGTKIVDVTAASSDAISLLRSNDYALVVLTSVMLFDSYTFTEVAKAIKRTNPNTTTLIWSAYTFPAGDIASLKEMNIECLSKGGSFNELLTHITLALDNYLRIKPEFDRHSAELKRIADTIKSYAAKDGYAAGRRLAVEWR